MHSFDTEDLLEAIQQHPSSGPEADQVIQRFHRLTENEKQDILDFLRSL